jgi:hypothetical protein
LNGQARSYELLLLLLQNNYISHLVM